MTWGNNVNTFGEFWGLTYVNCVLCSKLSGGANSRVMLIVGSANSRVVLIVGWC